LNRTERTRFVLERLREAIPQPETELHFGDAYELTVAVVLSAQCTDERVNQVTPALFAAFPTVQALASATPEAVYPFIRSVSYPNNKARHLVGLAQRVVEEHGGEIPRRFEDLVKLPGVGRKTAQVVQSVAFEDEALPVDTHIFRVANRIGLTGDAPTPFEVERQLKRAVPRDAWSEVHHLLLLHGRYTCTARNPACEACPVRAACRYYAQRSKLPGPLPGLDPRRGRAYCRTGGHYFDEPAARTDRHGVAQAACPRCGSMNVFDVKTGRTLKKVPDYRVN
jgi:endonuclease-3